jgi:hypothetical protein
MSKHTTPYDFGGAETDGGLTDPDPSPDEATTVIVDGATMTFRAYRRRGG